jgi:hypothetical protein
MFGSKKRRLSDEENQVYIDLNDDRWEIDIHKEGLITKVVPEGEAGKNQPHVSERDFSETVAR